MAVVAGSAVVIGDASAEQDDEWRQPVVPVISPIKVADTAPTAGEGEDNAGASSQEFYAQSRQIFVLRYGQTHIMPCRTYAPGWGHASTSHRLCDQPSQLRWETNIFTARRRISPRKPGINNYAAT